jgi:hypothetical protein
MVGSFWRARMNVFAVRAIGGRRGYIEVLFAFDTPIDPDAFDEYAMEEAFLAMPSGAVH